MNKPLFKSTNAPNDSSFSIEMLDQADLTSSYHYHPQYELTLIINGSGKRYIDNHIGHFDNGDLALLGPNLPHCWKSDIQSPQKQTDGSVTIQFSKDFLGEEFLHKNELSEIRQLLKRSQRGIIYNHQAVADMTEDFRKLAREEVDFKKLHIFLDIALSVVSGLVTLVVAYFLAVGLTIDRLPVVFGMLLTVSGLDPLSFFGGLGLFAVSAFVSLAFWLLEPVWTVIYSGVVGLAASTLVRSSGAAIGLVFALHLGLGLAVYAPAQQLAVLATLPLIWLPGSMSASAVVPVGVFVLQAVIGLVLNVAVMVGGVWLSLRRAAVLGD